MKEFIEKLIERLEKQKSEVNGLSDIVWNNAVKMCIYEVNQLAEEYGKDNNVTTSEYEKGYEDGAESVRALLPYEERNVGWIPCSEKEPNKDGYYLITTSDGEVDAREYDFGNGWGWDGFERIIAWMPLPEPFRPKGE